MGSSPRPWLVVAAAFGAMFVAFGSVNSFGVFFTPIAREFDQSRAAVSFVLGLSTGAFLLLGVVSGHLADRFGPRPVVAAGGLLVAAGYLGSSRATAMWQLYLTQGLVLGLAAACGMTASLGAVALWFPPHRRAMAIGVAVAGTGAGTLAYAPVARLLIDAGGWRYALAVLGIGGGALTVVCSMALHGRGAPVQSGMRVGDAIRSRPFRILWMGGLLTSFAFLVPIAHVVPYALDHGISPLYASLLLAAIGASGTIGRLALGVVAHRVGSRRAIAATMLGMGLADAYWLAATTRPALMAFAIAFGFAQGGFVTLLNTCAGDYFGAAKLAGIIGVLNTCAVLGSLVGPAAAGALFDAFGSYSIPIVASAAINVAGFAILLRLPEPAASH